MNSSTPDLKNESLDSVYVNQDDFYHLRTDADKRQEFLNKNGKDGVNITASVQGWHTVGRWGKTFPGLVYQPFYIHKDGRIFNVHLPPGQEISTSAKPTEYCGLHALVPPDVLAASQSINAQKAQAQAQEKRGLMEDIFPPATTTQETSAEPSATVQNDENQLNKRM